MPLLCEGAARSWIYVNVRHHSIKFQGVMAEGRQVDRPAPAPIKAAPDDDHAPMFDAAGMLTPQGADDALLCCRNIKADITDLKAELLAKLGDLDFGGRLLVTRPPEDWTPKTDCTGLWDDLEVPKIQSTEEVVDRSADQ